MSVGYSPTADREVVLVGIGVGVVHRDAWEVDWRHVVFRIHVRWLAVQFRVGEELRKRSLGMLGVITSVHCSFFSSLRE